MGLRPARGGAASCRPVRWREKIAGMSDARMRAVVLAALVCGAVVVMLVIESDHQEAKAIWAVFGPLVAWNFVATGLYAWRRRPEYYAAPWRGRWQRGG